MMAVVLTAYGDVDKFERREVPDPRAERGAIVVRMAGASINPVDWKIRSGEAKGRFPIHFPAILGRDASGEVVEVGQDVTSFKVGDRVLGLVREAYAELVAAPVESWAKVPDGLDLADAGALPLVLLTGAQLAERLRPARGAKILVTGAAGSVGRTALFAAKSRGAEVWAGVRASQRPAAERLGAAGVVALDDPSDLARLPVFDAIADTVDGDTIQRLYDKLKPGGTLGSVLGEPPNASRRGFTVQAFMSGPDAAMLARYAEAVAKGDLVIPIAMKMPLAHAAQAQAIAERQRPNGKVLLLGPGR